MIGALLMQLPVHTSSRFVVDLHAVHAAIALSGFRIFREDERQGDITSTIFGPALYDRKVEEGKIALTQDAFFAKAIFNYFGKHFSDFSESRNHLKLFDQALR